MYQNTFGQIRTGKITLQEVWNIQLFNLLGLWVACIISSLLKSLFWRNYGVHTALSCT